MTTNSKAGVFSVLMMVAALAGCGQSGLPNGNGGNGGAGGTVSLPQSVGRFVVLAGEEKSSKEILPRTNINSSGNLTLTLDQADISFTSEEGQAGTMLVSVAFGEVAGFDRACADPVDSYGPFTVTVSAHSEITSISGQFEVAPTTVDLLTGGSYTVCVTFSSTAAGTVIIDAFSIE